MFFYDSLNIVFAYNMNCLVSLTEKACAYCAVRNESINAIQLNLSLYKVKEITEVQ